MLRFFNWLVKLFKVKLFIAADNSTYNREYGTNTGDVVHCLLASYFIGNWIGADIQVQITSTSVGYTINIGQVTFVQINLYGPKMGMRTFTWPEPNVPLCPDCGRPESEPVHQDCIPF